MAGYAVVAVIHGASVQARGATPAADFEGPPPEPTTEVLDLTPPGHTAVLVRLGERWTAIRDQFGQLTWYLVNPEGWR